MITDRNLKVGDKLVAKFKGVGYHVDVQAGEDTRLAYEAIDGPAAGTRFKSLSSAGKAITGNECNGWSFWAVEGAEPPVKINTRALKAEIAKAGKPKAEKKARVAVAKKARGKKAARALAPEDLPEVVETDDTAAERAALEAEAVA